MVGDFLHGRVDVHGGAVRPVRGDGFNHVGAGDDPRLQKNVLPLQSLRIAGPVHPFVVLQDDLRNRIGKFNRLENIVGVPAVGFDHLHFQGAQSPRLGQNLGRDGNLADVMKLARDPNGFHPVHGQEQLLRDDAGDSGHLLFVAGRVRVPAFHDSGHGQHRPSQNHPDFFQAGPEFFQALVQVPGFLPHFLFQSLVEVQKLGILFFDQLIQPAVFPHQIRLAQHLPDRVKKILPAPGLGQIPVNASAVDRVDDGVRVRVARQQHPQGVGTDMAGLGEKLHARHAGHVLVGNDQGNVRGFFQKGQPFFRGAGRQQIISLIGQHRRHDLEDGFFVVNQQDRMPVF